MVVLETGRSRGAGVGMCGCCVEGGCSVRFGMGDGGGCGG